MTATFRLLPQFLLSIFISSTALSSATKTYANEVLNEAIDRDYSYLESIYIDIHKNPELHDQERETSARLAAEMEKAGFTVQTRIGGYGVVGILKNGEGPVLAIRTVMDALPIKENTNLPYASGVTAIAADGTEVPVSHSCGHDAMMASSIGAIRFLSTMREKWEGTLILIAQPADENLVGARGMIEDGLLSKIPRPDYIVGYHLLPTFPSQKVAWVKGHVTTGAETATIIVRGIPGHGSFPEDAKDPVPLAAQIVLALQTLITREVSPLEVASLNIGSIHGGFEVNAIPEKVELKLTTRFYSERVRDQLITGIERIAINQARAYGIPDELLPIVTFLPSGLNSSYNDPDLTQLAVKGFQDALGEENVLETKKILGTDETNAFSYAYEPAVPLLFFFYGSSNPKALEASKNGGDPLPSLHSAEFAPELKPTLNTGTKALIGLTLSVLEKKTR
jgi:amidohydrolase